jgi:hypothetical protein
LRVEEEKLRADMNLYLEWMQRLELEKKQSEEARAKLASIEREKSAEYQQRLEAERRLQEEMKRIEAERERLEKEKKKLAYIPKTLTSTKVSLRKESKTLRDDHVKEMLKKYRFFDSNWNKFGSFNNDFVDNGDGTVTDRATGLLWQKSGSSRSVTWRRAKDYIDKLNRNQFAGYSDWRLPTIDELASLFEKSKKDGLHIDPVFDGKQERCWSSDNRPDPLYGSWGLFATWIGNFSNGRIIEAKWGDRTAAVDITQQYSILPENHVRLVRSLRR